MDQRVDNLIRERCYVDGQWVGEPQLSVTNPATGAEIAKVPLTDAAGTRRAIEAADAAVKT
jgi:succinate-semialdehyde dehydrogenase/glutarate-semialdehyde dehydrogenase